jgi:hypothetical protein
MPAMPPLWASALSTACNPSRIAGIARPTSGQQLGVETKGYAAPYRRGAERAESPK